MVKFYSLTFSMAHDVVCIRQHKLMAKGEKKWSGKKLAVEGTKMYFKNYSSLIPPIVKSIISEGKKPKYCQVRFMASVYLYYMNV